MKTSKAIAIASTLLAIVFASGYLKASSTVRAFRAEYCDPFYHGRYQFEGCKTVTQKVLAIECDTDTDCYRKCIEAARKGLTNVENCS